MKKQCYMTEGERYQLEAMRRNKIPVAEIARQLNRSRQTIYNELRRGSYLHTVDYRDVIRYSAEKGQDIRQRAARRKGRAAKVKNDTAYLAFLEAMILDCKFSPAAALEEAEKVGFTTSICVTTLYTYITRRKFERLRDIDLPEKVSRKPRKKDEEQKVAHPKLPSIEVRPEEIGRRTAFGHWEMDLVVSARGGSSALLVMTERRSRKEIITLIPNKCAESVRRAIDRIERKTPQFRQQFRSITTDNGSEFLEYDKLIQSCRSKRQRFEVYYCHSYAAWEKGSCENHNRIIRRFFPKGTNFDEVTPQQVKAVQDWMNDYPRKILGWKTPNEICNTILGAG